MSGATWPMDLGSILLDAAVRATLILALALVLARLTRGASAGTRHALWSAALIGTLLVPALTLALPTVPLPVFPRAERSLPVGSGIPESAAIDRAPARSESLSSTQLPPDGAEAGTMSGDAPGGAVRVRESAGGLGRNAVPIQDVAPKIEDRDALEALLEDSGRSPGG